MFPTLFLIVAILFVEYVDVEVIVGHFNIVLGEGVPQLLIDGVVGGPRCTSNKWCIQWNLLHSW